MEKMVPFPDQFCFIAIITVCVLAVVSSKKLAEGKRERFHARPSKDLMRQLADADFELMTQLESFKETWKADEDETSESLLAAAVET